MAFINDVHNLFLLFDEHITQHALHDDIYNLAAALDVLNAGCDHGEAATVLSEPSIDSRVPPV